MNGNQFLIREYTNEGEKAFKRLVIVLDKLFDNISKFEEERQSKIYGSTIAFNITFSPLWIHKINWAEVTIYSKRFSNAEYMALLSPKIREYKKEHNV